MLAYCLDKKSPISLPEIGLWFGVEGFEPPTYCSQSSRASQAALCSDTHETQKATTGLDFLTNIFDFMQQNFNTDNHPVYKGLQAERPSKLIARELVLSNECQGDQGGDVQLSHPGF